MVDDPNETDAPIVAPAVIETALADTVEPSVIEAVEPDPPEDVTLDVTRVESFDRVDADTPVIAAAPLPIIEEEPPASCTVVLATDYGVTYYAFGNEYDARRPFLLLQGVSWYHKTEDADGRWVYRKD